MSESTCLACGGLIMEPNKTYGWGGKVCYCQKQTPLQNQFVYPIQKQLEDIISRIEALEKREKK